jgi:hypothetical protein
MPYFALIGTSMSLTSDLPRERESLKLCHSTSRSRVVQSHLLA